ncbi:hypothetical protein J31TS4_16700 [Paenibacillus sp. J31TS4]|uniref:phosphotransferase-like protein n=1 Tax=Paenibacillus sp. J31TS4 TaxID=2807195 RepID=UPI001B286FAB|nr:AAA family ATPase [Paenibacillus sp. J31TS4]GIP38390.1 hypothetical protein J31TS4_16700 [Paenibacillus sp. J31TS4]
MRTRKTDQPGIYLLTGVMASGKSTVAQLLAERFGRGVHVRGDAFRRMIVSGREEMLPEHSEEAVAQLRLRYRIAAGAAEAYAQEGFDVVLQDVILGAHLEEVVRSIRHRPLYVVVLVPDASAVANREAARGKKGYGLWTVEMLDDKLRRETPRIGMWLDTTEQTPEETVEAILSRAEREARV